MHSTLQTQKHSGKYVIILHILTSLLYKTKVEIFKKWIYISTMCTLCFSKSTTHSCMLNTYVYLRHNRQHLPPEWRERIGRGALAHLFSKNNFLKRYSLAIMKLSKNLSFAWEKKNKTKRQCSSIWMSRSIDLKSLF